MRFIDLSETADYLESATIDLTIDQGSAIAHIGKNIAGVQFLIVNNCMGETVLTESM